MKKILTLAAVALSLSSFAHVRQRSWFQFEEQNVKGGGIEAIIRWTAPFSIRMHQFSGCLGAGSSFSFDGSDGECADDAQSLIGGSIGEWLSPSFLGVIPSVNVALDINDNPISTNSACEVKTDGTADGINNVLFSSKINPACADSVENYVGVIGLTRVRYALDSGRIVEADIQFNDVDYRFVSTPSDLNSSNPTIINLGDVATHEFGHLFGLDHSASRTSSMLFAVSDGMASASSDDVAGMWSLYPNSSSGLGSLRGSVALGAVPVFGVPVYLLNVRTLELVASDMTNLDGAFEFCGIPEGNYIAYANSYRPASTNIHEYYSGFNGFAPEDSGLCVNPGCRRMNTSVKYSWFTESTEPDFGKTMRIFSVSGGTKNQYLNIAATSTDVSLDPIVHSGTSDLALDAPRIMKLRSANIGVNSSITLGSNTFNVTAPDSGELEVRLASLSLYARMDLDVELRTSEGEVIPGGGGCVITPSEVSSGHDPYLVCNALTGGAEYQIVVTATGVPCGDVPGNFSPCNSSADEVASTPIPYYLITAFDPTINADGIVTSPLSNSTLATSKFSDLPSCSKFVTEKSESEEPACCGSIGGGGIDPGKSIWLGLIMSPLTWLLIAIAFVRLRRRFSLDQMPFRF
jgi:hypothetical protein